MKVSNTHLPPVSGTVQPEKKQAVRSGSGSDDVHLSELVRSLRSLVPDSPERQERIEQIARAYANGTYKVNAEATAAKIIDDSLQYP
jgi:flagellar biosynthesis anti-sigma factor FlgM